MIEDTSNEELPNIHQPDQFDLRQGHSSNRHFQWKSMACSLKTLYCYVIATVNTKLNTSSHVQVSSQS